MISEARVKSLVKEETLRYLEEKKGTQKGNGKGNKKKDAQVSRRDQANIRNKVQSRDGSNILNVSAIARSAGLDQSLVNRYIKGGVHDGTRGWVPYTMPKKAAKKILAAIGREKVG